MRGADLPGDDHWPRHARQWALVGPPLRPSPSDVAAVRAQLPRFGPAPRGLVLGVTPELIGAGWPATARLIAIERSAEVIAALGDALAVVDEVVPTYELGARCPTVTWARR